jgi:glycosyltransferase involved in cell wall biosynthesis
MTTNPKITAIMCTYGRMTVSERAYNMFLAQTYANKELVIFNTCIDHPYTCTEAMVYNNVIVVNNGIDYRTNQPYADVGSIRRDALAFHCSGDYVITWDDDDVFLPWFMQQGIDRIKATGLPAFKPEKSFFYSGDNLRLVKNTMEASVVVSYEKLIEYGYRLETGYEGLGWYTKLRDAKELDENDPYFVPSYCFNWNDGDLHNAPHKQSGDIDNPNNFNNHKNASTDYCNRPLRDFSPDEMAEIYKPYYLYLNTNREDFAVELYELYVQKTINA